MKAVIGLLAILLVSSLGSSVCAQTADAPAAAASSAAEGASHFDDSAKVLLVDADWIQRWAGKLDEFERATGIRILVALRPKSPPEDEDKVPGAYMHAFSTKLGLDRVGVLAAYFADEDDWRVWIGDELTPRFVGHAGTVKELTDSKAIHDTKEAFFTATWAKSDATFAALQKTAATNSRPTPADRLRIRTEMLLDGLMERLRRKT